MVDPERVLQELLQLDFGGPPSLEELRTRTRARRRRRAAMGGGCVMLTIGLVVGIAMAAGRDSPGRRLRVGRSPTTSPTTATTTPTSDTTTLADPARLVAVRVGAHGAFDRVVFQFEGGVPSPHDVVLAEQPSRGECDPQPVAGSRFANLVLAVDTAPSPDGLPGGVPRRIRAKGTTLVEEVV